MIDSVKDSGRKGSGFADVERLKELGYPDSVSILKNIIGTGGWEGRFSDPLVSFKLLPDGVRLRSRIDEETFMGKPVLGLYGRQVGILTPFDKETIDTLYRVGTFAGETFFNMTENRHVSLEPLGLIGWTFVYVKFWEHVPSNRRALSAIATELYCEYETDAILLGNYMFHAGVDA